MDVAERYVAVLRTRAARDAAIAQVEALRAHVGDVEAMVEQGAVNRSDLLASRVALANAEQARLRAERSRAEARAAYNRRVGQPLDREPDLAVAIAPPALDEATPLAALQERAVQSRSELDALAAEARAWEARARAESGRQLPQLGLSAGFHRIESTVLDREDFTMVGIGFRWQLFDGGQSRQRARSLRRAGQAAALRRDDLEADIRIEVEQAWLGVAEADARAAAARESVAEADENLRMSREQYTAELVANTQVLDAVALQLAATANARDAVLDAALARLRLARAVGAL
jgi:outer membrane protein TolC